MVAFTLPVTSPWYTHVRRPIRRPRVLSTPSLRWSRVPAHEPCGDTEDGDGLDDLESEAVVEGDVAFFVGLEPTDACITVEDGAQLSQERSTDAATLEPGLDADRTDVPVLVVEIARGPMGPEHLSAPRVAYSRCRPVEDGGGAFGEERADASAGRRHGGHPDGAGTAEGAELRRRKNVEEPREVVIRKGEPVERVVAVDGEGGRRVDEGPSRHGRRRSVLVALEMTDHDAGHRIIMTGPGRYRVPLLPSTLL